MTIRIAKFIADCGAASRRVAEEMISTGRVSVNGEKIFTPVTFVNPTDRVTIDGHVIRPRDDCKLYAFHKPVNTMTTAHDPAGRRTIYDCMPMRYKNLKYVGRLDFQTTGLLLMTNDGELARKLTLPQSNIPRIYIATIGNVDMSGLDAARRGITIDGVSYRPMKIDSIGGGRVRVMVTEGKKNEVRIVLAACGCPVRKLHRVAFGPIKLGNMSPGQIIPVPQKTIDAMLKSL